MNYYIATGRIIQPPVYLEDLSDDFDYDFYDDFDDFDDDEEDASSKDSR